jgi:hypothetical protein
MSASSRCSDLLTSPRRTSVLRAAFFSSAAILAALPLLGTADELSDPQGVPLPELIACSELHSGEKRLACFDDLVNAALSAELPKPIKAQPVPEIMPEVAVTADAAEVATIAVPMVTAEPIEQTVSEPATASDFGLPEPAREPSSRSVTLPVSRVDRDSRERLVFNMEDGSIWRQIRNEYLSYPRKEAFAAEISRGMMGDYQLRINGRGRSTRVERIR